MVDAKLGQLEGLATEGPPALRSQMQTLRIRVSASEEADRKLFRGCVERLDKLEDRLPSIATVDQVLRPPARPPARACMSTVG